MAAYLYVKRNPALRFGSMLLLNEWYEEYVKSLGPVQASLPGNTPGSTLASRSTDGTFPVSLQTPRRALFLSEPPSDQVRQAMRNQYGDVVDFARFGVLVPSKTRISAFTNFTFEGYGFTPNSDVLVTFGKADGEQQTMLGNLFRTDATGHLRGSFQMPDPQNTPLGQYTLIAFDQASIDQSLAAVMQNPDAAITVLVAGAMMDVVADTEPPVINVLSPAATNYTRCDQPLFSFDVTDELSGVDWINATLDGQPRENGSQIDMLFENLGPHTVQVSSADRVGNQAEKSLIYQLQAMLPGVSCAINRFGQSGLISKQGTVNGLQAKVQAAIVATNRGQSNAARGQLEAFLSLLHAQKGKSIDLSAWQILAGDVKAILAGLNKK